jgi:two-component sensor histidine kinase
MIELYPSQEKLQEDASRELKELLTDLRKRLTYLTTAEHVNHREKRTERLERLIRLLEGHYPKIVQDTPDIALEMLFDIRCNVLK